jgi:hypothetical protein
MPIDEAEDDDALVISCKHCGTVSRFGLNEAASDEALTCRKCGAPLEAAPPQEKDKNEKGRSDYERSVDDAIWAAYWRERRKDYPAQAAKIVAVIIGAAMFVLCLLLNIYGR